MQTKLIQIGDSQAVSIPREFAFEPADIELEIERVGEELRIRPAQRSLAGALEIFSAFSPNFMDESRGDHEQAERIPQ